jgi:hypothetical protein
MKPMKKVRHNDELWCGVGDGARYLGTNAQKIRALMGSGQIRYAQLRLNGRLYVNVNDLSRLRNPDNPIEVKPRKPSPG